MNLSIHCELGQFAIASICKVLIQLERDAESGKYKFVTACNRDLIELYKNADKFFEQMHDELTKIFSTQKSTHHIVDDEGKLFVSPWLLEMRHRDLSMQPRRHHLVTVQLVQEKILRAFKLLTVAHLPTKDNITHVLEVIRPNRLEYLIIENSFVVLLGRTADIITYKFDE